MGIDVFVEGLCFPGAKYDVEEVWLIVTARWNKCHTAGVSLGAIKRDSFNSSVKDLST